MMNRGMPVPLITFSLMKGKAPMSHFEYRPVEIVHYGRYLVNWHIHQEICILESTSAYNNTEWYLSSCNNPMDCLLDEWLGCVLNQYLQHLWEPNFDIKPFATHQVELQYIDLPDAAQWQYKHLKPTHRQSKRWLREWYSMFVPGLHQVIAIVNIVKIQKSKVC